MADFKVPGAAVAIVQGGEVVWSRGFGIRDQDSKGPVSDDTLFEAASVSKTVFSYAALKLCEKGIIELDTPLSRYTARPFVEGDRRLDQITARRILSHSSGLAEWRSNDGPMIRSEPGSAFDYSGEGYFYLQSVITHLTGKTDSSQCAKYEADFEVCATDFDEFMKRNLLQPFGMRFSRYLSEPGRNQTVAIGHDTRAKPIIKGTTRRSDVARYGAVGGLKTSASEYAKFLIEVVAPKSPDNFRLSGRSLKEMARPQIKLGKGGEIDGCSSWALGWGVRERAWGNLLVHSGGQAGFRSLALASVERKSGFIILTNSDNGGKLINEAEMMAMAEKLVMGG
jgi:CubicO group peptidase (beta-lactamase class C family)